MASPEEMAASMRANILEKTGRQLTDWFQTIKENELDKHGKIVALLKKEYSVTHGFANLIAHDYLSKDSDEEPDLVAAQYSGTKEHLKVIYDELINKISQFGDVDVSPKKNYVSLRRNKQFALIQPSTKTRVDVGINLKGEPNTERLEKSGSFNTMVSHRVRVSHQDEVNDELISWLKLAYDRS